MKLGIGGRRFGIGSVAGVMLVALLPGLASAQSSAAPKEVEVAPIECWWKTDRGAVRVGERFFLTLTCAVVDTDHVKVVVDESSLAPSALQLAPFEIVEGQRFRDVRNSPRRFFQYQYTVRLIGDQFFGKELTLPGLQVPYRVQTSEDGASATAGRESQYSLRPVAVGILSIVPGGVTEVRDTPSDTIGEVDSRLFRSNLLLIAAGVALGLAACLIVVLLVRTALSRRAAVTSKHRAVSPGVILRAASNELARIRKASDQDGWNGELAGQAAAALRLAGAVALSRPLAQREVERETKASEGQIVVGQGIRGKKIVLSSGVTPGSAGRDGAAPLWEGIRQSLAVFSIARYSRNGDLDRTALDAALAEGQDLVKQLRRDQWRRIGRSRRSAPSEAGAGKQSWAR